MMPFIEQEAQNKESIILMPSYEYQNLCVQYSIAISLKRIADHLENSKQVKPSELGD